MYKTPNSRLYKRGEERRDGLAQIRRILEVRGILTPRFFHHMYSNYEKGVEGG